MFFVFVLVIAIGMLVGASQHVNKDVQVDPWAYLFVCVGWCLFAIPQAYKLSFGG